MAKFERLDGIAARVSGQDDDILSFEEKIAKLPSLSPTQLDCLLQLITPVWDGNLISKAGRSELCSMGLVARWDGLNFCTQDGYCVLETLGYLKDSDRFTGGKPWKKAAR